MSYIDETLLADEHVVYRTTLHWIIFARGALVLLVGVAVLIALLRQVEALSVDQTLGGRMLGYGTITLSGTGGVREIFHRVRAPLELRRRIQGQVA